MEGRTGTACCQLLEGMLDEHVSPPSSQTSERLGEDQLEKEKQQANTQVPMLGVLLPLRPPSLTSLGSSSPGHAGSPRMGCASFPFLPQVKGTMAPGSPLRPRRSCRFRDPLSLLPWAVFQFAQDEGSLGCLSRRFGASSSPFSPTYRCWLTGDP